jgi:hypothetical protein
MRRGGVGPTVVVGTADRLDRVVGERRAGGHEDVDEPIGDQVRDDRPHPRRHHRTREPHHRGDRRIVEHLGEDVDRLGEVDRPAARCGVRIDQLLHAHPGGDAGLPERRIGELAGVCVIHTCACTTAG